MTTGAPDPVTINSVEQIHAVDSDRRRRFESTAICSRCSNGFPNGSPNRMRRRVQGEDARCSVPWAGHGPTPHEPWPAQHAKAAREGSPLLGRWHRTWRYGTDRRRIGGPFAGPRPRSMDSGKPTSEAFGAGSERGRHGTRQGKPHRMRLKRLPGRGETHEDPSRRGHPKAPEGASGTTSKAREEPGNSCPPQSSRKGTSQARTRAPLPRRERAPPLSRRTRRRAGLPNPSSRQRNEARAASHHHRRAAIPVAGTATHRFAVCRVDHPHRTRGPRAHARGAVHAGRRSGAFT